MKGPVARVRRGIALTIRAKVAGSDADAQASRIWDAEGPRWFGSEDAIRQVNTDVSMYIGGIRALLLQSLHPSAMAGVAGHSGYKSDPWGRLQRTANFIAMTSFGPIDAAQATIDHVRSIHARVRGKTDDGTPYRADDPHLLEWVHCAETDSFLDAHRRFGAHRLTPAQENDYVAQSAQISRRLGAVDLPGSVAELQARLEGFRPELRATDAAREAARFLLFDPPVPAIARPGYWMLAAGAVACLPGWARAELRLPRLPILDAAVGLPLGKAGTTAIRWAMSDPSLVERRRPEPESAKSGR